MNLCCCRCFSCSPNTVCLQIFRLHPALTVLSLSKSNVFLKLFRCSAFLASSRGFRKKGYSLLTKQSFTEQARLSIKDLLHEKGLDQGSRDWKNK